MHKQRMKREQTEREVTERDRLRFSLLLFRIARRKGMPPGTYQIVLEAMGGHQTGISL